MNMNERTKSRLPRITRRESIGVIAALAAGGLFVLTSRMHNEEKSHDRQFEDIYDLIFKSAYLDNAIGEVSKYYLGTKHPSYENPNVIDINIRTERMQMFLRSFFINTSDLSNKPLEPDYKLFHLVKGRETKGVKIEQGKVVWEFPPQGARDGQQLTVKEMGDFIKDVVLFFKEYKIVPQIPPFDPSLQLV